MNKKGPETGEVSRQEKLPIYGSISRPRLFYVANKRLVKRGCVKRYPENYLHRMDHVQSYAAYLCL